MWIKFPAQFYNFALTVALFNLLGAMPVGAQVVEQSEGECSIGVRVLGAAEESNPAVAAMPEEQQLKEDLGDQLRQLPFSHYRNLDFAEKKIKFDHLGRFVLHGAEPQEQFFVSVVPHDLSKGRVHMTVDWNANTRGQLVSSRMRLVNGKHLVLGTDGSGNSSTILCIKAQCTEP